MVSAKGIFKEAARLGKEGTPAEKEEFHQEVKDSFRRAGEVFLARAIIEGVVSRQEMDAWEATWGLNIADFGVVLGAYYAKKDGHIKPKDNAIVLTVKGSVLDRMRHVMLEKFGIKILTLEEGVVEFKASLRGKKHTRNHVKCPRCALQEIEKKERAIMQAWRERK